MLLRRSKRVVHAEMRCSPVLSFVQLAVLALLWLPHAAHANAPSRTHQVDIVEVEVRGDASAVPSSHSLDELERAALAEEQAQAATKEGPAIESLLADFDQDGQVGSQELDMIKQNLHHIFDVDASGDIDTKEIKSMAKDDKDVLTAFQKLDRDQDSVISLQELDARWEAVGAEMTVSEVADWVAYSVQLPQYSEMFRQHSISGYTFPLLMQDNGRRLQDIGVTRDMHRQQLAMFLKIKYLGMGIKPGPVKTTHCSAEVTPGLTGTAKTTVLYISWEAADENVPLRYQLQRRSPGESTWMLVHSGPDTEFMDVVDADQHVIYRLATWNSYGRSTHSFIRCDRSQAMVDPRSLNGVTPSSSSLEGEALATIAPTTPRSSTTKQDSEGCANEPSIMDMLKCYLWWLDEAIALTLFIVLPIRGFIYGDANSVLRLFRRLPPNMPTRVTVEADPSKTTIAGAAVKVSWERPVDNGVAIVCYCVRWTRLKTDEVKWIKLLTIPLPTQVSIEHLYHGETYKVVVEATNAFGLVTKSSRSTYMVPVPELKGKLRPQRSMKEVPIVRNQCYVCLDPAQRKAVPLFAQLDRRILHFCSRCDHEFCHYHKGEVFHTKALACPAVDGRCLCPRCQSKMI